MWILKFAMKNHTHNLSDSANISFSVGLYLVVDHYLKKLKLENYLKTLVLKKKEEFFKRIKLLVTNRLSEYFSINFCAKQFGQNSQFLKEIDLKPFIEKTLYRDVEDLGKNFYSSIHYVNRQLASIYNFEKERINIDWSSITLFGETCSLAKYGFSKDHRPDKKQINIGVANIATKKNMPLMLTIQEGNIPDVTHFETIFRQCLPYVKKESLFVYDNGGDSEKNRNQVLNAKMHLLTRKRINNSDKPQLKKFNKALKNKNFKEILIIDEKREVYGLYHKPKNSKYHTYYFFSKELYEKKVKSKNKHIDKKFLEAQEIETYFEKHNKLPAKYRLKNPLLDIKISYQKRLKKLDKEKAKKVLLDLNPIEFEGYFALVSSTKLEIKEAFDFYKEKDSIERLIGSLKNTIQIKPLRAKNEDTIRGLLLIGYISYLILGLLQYEVPELQNIDSKFIKLALSNLTLTVKNPNSSKIERIFSNFNQICQNIFGKIVDLRWPI